jgi:hypothetical protein
MSGNNLQFQYTLAVLGGASSRQLGSHQKHNPNITSSYNRPSPSYEYPPYPQPYPQPLEACSEGKLTPRKRQPNQPQQPRAAENPRGWLRSIRHWRASNGTCTYQRMRAAPANGVVGRIRPSAAGSRATCMMVVFARRMTGRSGVRAASDDSSRDASIFLQRPVYH